MNISEMRHKAAEVAELMKTLSHHNRLMVLCLLIEGEKSAGELARTLEVRESTMSQQLALLRKDGLVKTRRDGQTINYSLARGDIEQLMGFLYQTYCEN